MERTTVVATSRTEDLNWDADDSSTGRPGANVVTAMPPAALSSGRSWRIMRPAGSYWYRVQCVDERVAPRTNGSLTAARRPAGLYVKS